MIEATSSQNSSESYGLGHWRPEVSSSSKSCPYSQDLKGEELPSQTYVTQLTHSNGVKDANSEVPSPKAYDAAAPVLNGIPHFDIAQETHVSGHDEPAAVSNGINHFEIESEPHINGYGAKTPGLNGVEGDAIESSNVGQHSNNSIPAQAKTFNNAQTSNLNGIKVDSVNTFPVVYDSSVIALKGTHHVGIDIAAPTTYEPYSPGSTRLRHMVKNLDRIIVCPGVYDGLSARVALQIGFDGMYMTGAGTTASRLGAADLGIAQLHDMRTNAEMIANLQPDGPPLIADMDTGYGGPIVIAKAVKEYVRAGVAGFHIEDQVMQKRCGHLQGKEVVDIDTYIQRIKACKVAAAQLRSDIVIIARTDALQSHGYAECVKRLSRARDAGADMGILEGFATKEQARQAVLDMAPWPLCLNSVENGVSPLITVREAQDMGFRVMIFSFAGLAPAYTAIKNTFELLKFEGITGATVTPKHIFQVCGLNESMLIDDAAGGTTFAKGV